MAEQPEEQQAYTQWIYRHYGQPQIQEACLGLQEDHRLMVPILLHAAWMSGHRSLRVKKDALTMAEEQIKDFVMPLRLLRQNLRQHDNHPTKSMMRARLKKTEIAMEIDVMWGLAEATGADVTGLGHEDLVLAHLVHMGCDKDDVEASLRLIGALS